MSTFRDKIACHFLAHPHEWVSAYVLMDLGGKMAWRTRLSECRRELRMPIENRVRRLDDGEAVSEYRYAPELPPQQMEMGL